MPCLKLPQLTPPDLSILLPALDITIPNPHIGLSLCCELSLTIPLNIPPISLIPGVTIVLAPVTSVIMEAVDELNALLDSIQVDCPLE